MIIALLLASLSAAQVKPSALEPETAARGLIERSRQIRPSLQDEDDVYDRAAQAGLGWRTPIPLANLGLVSPGIYRSAQPEDGGMERLSFMGVRTILNLRKGLRGERELAQRHGMEVVHVPMRGLTGAPSFEQMDAAVAVLRDPAKRPVLVHCAYGKDRTGFVVAAYRVTVEGMPVDAAAAEAEKYGCCWWAFGDLRSYLKAYAARPLRAP